MGKSTVSRFTTQEKIALASEYKALSKLEKGVFLAKHRLHATSIGAWARGEKLGNHGRPQKNAPEPVRAIASPKYHPNKKLQAEVDRLTMENTVLRANLTMAMRAGYLDFLTLEKPSVK